MSCTKIGSYCCDFGISSIVLIHEQYSKFYMDPHVYNYYIYITIFKMSTVKLIMVLLVAVT